MYFNFIYLNPNSAKYEINLKAYFIKTCLFCKLKYEKIFINFIINKLHIV